MKSRISFIWILGIASLLLFVLFLWLVTQSSFSVFPSKQTIRLVGGNPNLTFHWIMQGIEKALEVEFETNYQKTNGAEENLKMLCTNEADIGLTHAHVVVPCTGVTAIANVFHSTLHIISTKESKINSIIDINDSSRVAIGPDGSGTALLAKEVLAYYEVAYTIIPVESFDDEKKLLEEGKIDVAFLVGGIPINFLKNLSNKERYQLVELVNCSAIIRHQPYLIEDKLEVGLYGSNPSFPGSEINTIAIPTILVVSPTFGNKRGNEQTIEKITQLIFENRNNLLRIHGSAMYLSEKFGRSDVAYPIHQGAERYYLRSSTGFFINKDIIELVGYSIGLLASILTIIFAFRSIKFRKESNQYIRLAQELMDKIQESKSIKQLEIIRESLYSLKKDFIANPNHDRESFAYQVITDAIIRVKWHIGHIGD